MEQEHLSPTIEQQLSSESLAAALTPTMEGLAEHEARYFRQALAGVRQAQSVLDFVVGQIQAAHGLGPNDRIHEEGYILRAQVLEE